MTFGGVFEVIVAQVHTRYILLLIKYYDTSANNM